MNQKEKLFLKNKKNMDFITPKKNKKKLKEKSNKKTLSKKISYDKAPNTKDNSKSLRKLLFNKNKLEMNQIIIGIQIILSEIISKNKFLPEYPIIIKEQKRNIFSLQLKPKISISNFLKRIIDHSKIEISTLIIGLIYLNKILEKGLFLTDFNVHKLLSISILIAIKYNEDIISFNYYYAQVFGLTLKDVNFLELSFLKKLDFNLYINDQYIKQFVTYIYGKIFAEFKV